MDLHYENIIDTTEDRDLTSHIRRPELHKWASASDGRKKCLALGYTLVFYYVSLIILNYVQKQQYTVHKDYISILLLFQCTELKSQCSIKTIVSS